MSSETQTSKLVTKEVIINDEHGVPPHPLIFLTTHVYDLPIPANVKDEDALELL